MAEVYFPDCIILNILARLPTKPLVQFKCVSKHWNGLISDPSFMNSRSRKMVLLPTKPLHAIDDTLSGDEAMTKLHFPFGNLEGKYVSVIGAFKGVVLLVIENVKNQTDNTCDMILYNPFTGKLKIIPEPCLREADHSEYVYGFGYGTNPDDLKIVRLASSKYERPYFRTCDVLSLKNGSWCTSLKLTTCHHITNKAGTFVNGFLYWMAYRRINNYIVALNVKEMVFSEIELPPPVNLLNLLGTFNGRLCCRSLISVPSNGVGYLLKVMDEDDDGKHYWSNVTNIFSIPADGVNDFGLMCILDDGKLVMPKGRNQIIIYDMLKGSYKEINNVASLEEEGKLTSVEYVESLISPFDICSALFKFDTL